MTALQEIRADLAAFLATTGATVHEGPLTNVDPPCWLIQPHPTNDYLTPDGGAWGSEVVALQLVLLASGSGDPLAQLDQIDEQLDKVRPLLQYGTSPSGRTYTYGPAGPPQQFTAGAITLPGIAFDITTTRTVEAPTL